VALLTSTTVANTCSVALCWSSGGIGGSVSSGNEGLGREIQTLLAELRRIPTSLTGLNSDSQARELQRQLDGKTTRLNTLRYQRDETAKERSWADAEVNGFQRALVLVGQAGATSDTGPGSAISRLEQRLETQISRSIELTEEINQIEGRIADIESDILDCQNQLIAALTRVVGSAKAQERQAEANRRRKAAARQAARAKLQAEAMWSPTAVLGYRVWILNKDGLYGARYRWETPSLTAVCRLPGELPHTDGRCAQVAFGCGIYAAKDSGALMRSVGGTHRGRFGIGLVGLEGKVVEHERGYRAERATVLAFALVDRGMMRMIEDEAEMEALFRNPLATPPIGAAIARVPTDASSLRGAIATYLKDQAQRRESWISAIPNA